ncbi:MAG: AsmA family protein, partial [Burkholderiaceae bacterium]|nr:AsmA family protein [Burkholderiaceae bacterium]
MKKILIGSVVVIGVVTVAGAVAVQSLLDGETITKELRKEAKSRLNRELTFAGPVNIKLFPKIAVQLPATSLSYANSDKPQVTLDSASVGVMVLPLLKGEVKLDTIKIDGLKGKINVERLKSALDRKQATIQVDGASKSVDEKRGGFSFIKDFSVHGIDVFN